MRHSRDDRTNLRRLVAGLVVPALLAIGCGDEVPTATIGGDNVEDLGVAAGEAAMRAALSGFLLMELGYVLPFGYEEEPSVASAPSPGVVPPPEEDELCSEGTSSLVFSETEAAATMTYDECVLAEFPCYIDGTIQLAAVENNEGPGGIEIEADGVTVECLGILELNLTNDRIRCETMEEIGSLDGCDFDIAPFDSAFGGAQLRITNFVISGGIDEGGMDVAGTVVAEGHGKFDFESLDMLTMGCPNNMPSDGVLGLFGSGEAWGAIVFDDECAELEVCAFADMESEPECEIVPYPGELVPEIM